MDLLIRFGADGLLLVIMLISVPVVLLAIRKAFWHRAPIIAMAGLTSLVAGKLASLFYQPAVARPFLELGVAPGASYIDNPGFPSDHALLATVVVTAVVATAKHRAVSVLLITFVVAMCTARVLALVHTPLDVIGGVLAGLVGALWYQKLTK